MQNSGLHIDDIVQIDEFIEHSKFHNEQYGDNVFEFISKHYGELKAEHEKEHQEEKDEHEELPFKHHSHIASLTISDLNSNVIEIITPDFSELTTDNFYYQPPTSSLHSKGLFQPPQIS